MNSLEVRELTVVVGHARHQLVAVDGVDLAVPEHGTLGLVGESGSGKSTLAKAIVGLLRPASGTIRILGKDARYDSRADRRVVRQTIQLVSQNPYASLNPRMRIEETLEEAVTVHRQLRRADRRREIARLLDAVSLPESVLGRYPYEFSGGQRQRIAIARALAPRPKVLIADEITSALDVSVQASILNLLREIQREHGLSLLFISHNLAIVRYMSDAVAVMYMARVIERASNEDLFADPQHPYTRALIEAIPQYGNLPKPNLGEVPDPRDPPRGCRYHTRCAIGPLTYPDRVACSTVDPQRDAVQRRHEAACHFVPKDSARGANSTLTGLGPQRPRADTIATGPPPHPHATASRTSTESPIRSWGRRIGLLPLLPR